MEGQEEARKCYCWVISVLQTGGCSEWTRCLVLAGSQSVIHGGAWWSRILAGEEAEGGGLPMWELESVSVNKNLANGQTPELGDHHSWWPRGSVWEVGRGVGGGH